MLPGVNKMYNIFPNFQVTYQRRIIKFVCYVEMESCLLLFPLVTIVSKVRNGMKIPKDRNKQEVPISEPLTSL